MKSALDYHTGARISSLEGQMLDHAKPLLFLGSGSFVFCVEYEFRRKTCSKATRTSLLVLQWPPYPQKGLGMQLKEEATGLKGAFLPFSSVLCRLGGFPLSRGNLVWYFLTWEDLGKSLCQKKAKGLTGRARAPACELGVQGRIWQRLQGYGLWRPICALSLHEQAEKTLRSTKKLPFQHN